mmetsp:Transcript_10523/g.36965  ORF Transcript_10523/g.36965 Transcript_10523/m.36965 type:complete len:210 (+) Transcript_10523:1744-2373(+)
MRKSTAPSVAALGPHSSPAQTRTAKRSASLASTAAAPSAAPPAATMVTRAEGGASAAENAVSSTNPLTGHLLMLAVSSGSTRPTSAWKTMPVVARPWCLHQAAITFLTGASIFTTKLTPAQPTAASAWPAAFSSSSRAPAARMRTCVRTDELTATPEASPCAAAQNEGVGSATRRICGLPAAVPNEVKLSVGASGRSPYENRTSSMPRP